MGVSRKNLRCRDEISGTEIGRAIHDTVEEGMSDPDMNALKFKGYPSNYPLRFLGKESRSKFRSTLESSQDEQDALSVQNSSLSQLNEVAGNETNTKFTRLSEEAQNSNHETESMLPIDKRSRLQDPGEGGASKSVACRKSLLPTN